VSIDFRDVPKRDIGARLPKAIETRIREEAFRARVSISSVLTRYVALGMRLDPSDFGLECPEAGPINQPENHDNPVYHDCPFETS
jgi:hypothetical protein